MAPASFYEASTSPFFGASSSEQALAVPSPFGQSAEAMSGPCFGLFAPFGPSFSKPLAVPSTFASNAGFIPSSNIIAIPPTSMADTTNTTGSASSQGFPASSSDVGVRSETAVSSTSNGNTNNINTKPDPSSHFGSSSAVNVNNATFQGSKSPSFAIPSIGFTANNTWAPSSFGTNSSAPNNLSSSQKAPVIGWSPFANNSEFAGSSAKAKFNGFSNTPAATSTNQSVFNSSIPTPNHFQFPQVFQPETHGGDEHNKLLCPECGHTFKEEQLGSRVVACSPTNESAYIYAGKGNAQKNRFEILRQRPQGILSGMPLMGFLAVPWISEPAPLYSTFSAPSSQNSFMIAPFYGHPSLGMPSPQVVQL